MIKLRYKMVVFIFAVHSTVAFAQEKQLSIEECYELARQNYPLIRKHDLIEKSGQFSISNAAKMFLPQLAVNGQASYQSETISFPDALSGIPGVSLPALSKDQYRLQAEVTQQLYDGGTSRRGKELARANEQAQQQGLEVSLNALKERVNQLFFSVLLMDEQMKQSEISRSGILSALNKATAAYRNGTAYKSNVDELKAESMNADMTIIELKANRKAYTKALGLLIARQVDDSTRLVMPFAGEMNPEIHRPELQLYNLQKKTFDIQEKQLRADYLPRVNAFFQGAYGRPTLNIIENTFGPWWVGGLRLNWSLGGLYSQKNDLGLLNINRQNADIDKETFLFNTRIALSTQNEEIEKYRQLLQKDETVILLRSAVVQSARAQLDNGVITTHEFISKLNDETLAKQAAIVHRIRLLQAQFNYKNTSGN